ncbi:unnamed protein product [Timema podura]|uniref:Uncharacterized protein n=1 Tax=Timema podura TaxID=61482 RepID=A0ABN7NRP2_TIMPD|nr:unnamed protein product [Timema podura]
MLSIFDSCGIDLPKAIPTAPGRVSPWKIHLSKCHLDLAKLPKATTLHFINERTFNELLSTRSQGFKPIYTDGSKSGASVSGLRPCNALKKTCVTGVNSKEVVVDQFDSQMAQENIPTPESFFIFRRKKPTADEYKSLYLPAWPSLVTILVLSGRDLVFGFTVLYVVTIVFR